MLRKFDYFMKRHGFLEGWWMPLVQLTAMLATGFFVILIK